MAAAWPSQAVFTRFITVSRNQRHLLITHGKKLVGHSREQCESSVDCGRFAGFTCQTGDRTAGPSGTPRRSKLDPHCDYILGLVETTLDMTISEMLDKLAVDRDVYAARATLWILLDRCGLTF